MFDLLKRIFDNNEREVQRYWKTVAEPTGALEPEIEKLGDLVAAYNELREQRKRGADPTELMPRVFALVRESAKRHLGMRHFDVQMVGGAALYEGRITEMKTGEGKTLVETLPIALAALEGKGIHLVTVNDYLARRDAEWMQPIYRGLGLSAGTIRHDSSPEERKQAYLSDVTYVTNSELGFDYLRDYMAMSPEQLVLRHDTPLHYAIVDEVDSILIDEARTPLIISGPAEKATDLYYRMAEISTKLERGVQPEPGERDKEATGDYTVDEKQKNVQLTNRGIAQAEKLLNTEGLFSPENMEKAHMMIQALRAKDLYFHDRDYINQDGQIIIVDEFTGRLMPGRRYGEGLHQAIEAKEGVKIERENQTLATITYQNFFRQYDKLAGMTGTAKTEDKEFQEIYNRDVVVIPTNRPMIRQDNADVVYRTEAGKFFAVVEEIAERFALGQPMLVGTISIDKSERLSAMLREARYYLPRVEMRATNLLKRIEKQQGAEWDKLRKQLERPANLKAGVLNEFDPLFEKLKGATTETWMLLEQAVHTLDAIRKGIPDQVLNAKHHEREAEIIAQAGRSGTVTIATNMAGRGTDIKLGGSPEHMAAALLDSYGLDKYADWRVELLIQKLIQGLENEAQPLIKELEISDDLVSKIREMRQSCTEDGEKVKQLGGLHIIGTERHESRRIDNQLRGRSGRQGDPGSSRFFVSFDDELLRLFASERVIGMLDRMGFDDSEPLEQRMITSAIERAQKRVEDRNFGTRKQLLQFDDVMSRQREVIYEQRRIVLLGSDDEVRDAAVAMMDDSVADVVDLYLNTQIHPEDWDLESLRLALVDLVPGLDKFEYEKLRKMKPEEGQEAVYEATVAEYEVREQQLTPTLMRGVERFVLLSVVDSAWKEHLHNLDVLRQGIGLRAYGQRDPFQEYKIEATRVFNEMISSIKSEATKFLFRLQVETEPQRPQVYLPMPEPRQAIAAQPISSQGQDPARTVLGGKPAKGKPHKIGRNDPCWCGSGKKYKHCHGKSN